MYPLISPRNHTLRPHEKSWWHSVGCGGLPIWGARCHPGLTAPIFQTLRNGYQSNTQCNLTQRPLHPQHLSPARPRCEPTVALPIHPRRARVVCGGETSGQSALSRLRLSAVYKDIQDLAPPPPTGAHRAHHGGQVRVTGLHRSGWTELLAVNPLAAVGPTQLGPTRSGDELVANPSVGALR